MEPGEKRSQKSASSQSQTMTRPGSGFRAAKMATVSSPLIHLRQTCGVTDGERERDVRRLNMYAASVACVPPLLVVIPSGIQELTFSSTPPHLSA